MHPADSTSPHNLVSPYHICGDDWMGFAGYTTLNRSIRCRPNQYTTATRRCQWIFISMMNIHHDVCMPRGCPILPRQYHHTSPHRNSPKFALCALTRHVPNIPVRVPNTNRSLRQKKSPLPANRNRGDCRITCVLPDGTDLGSQCYQWSIETWP